MSLSATIEGRITFADDAHFAAAEKVLRDNGWVGADGRFVDEGGDVVPPGVGVDAADRSVTIPFAIYRNLIRLLGVETPLFAGATGRVIWTCLDNYAGAGVFVVADGKVVEDEEIDLEAWGTEHLGTPPPDPEPDPEVYLEWLARAEWAWLERHF